MDTCPVATLDMSHPTRPGVDGSGLYPLDDGTTCPGETVHRLLGLSHGVSDRRNRHRGHRFRAADASHATPRRQSAE